MTKKASLDEEDVLSCGLTQTSEYRACIFIFGSRTVSTRAFGLVGPTINESRDSRLYCLSCVRPNMHTCAKKP